MSASPTSASTLTLGPTDRKASWLELFYDLVYVIAISRVAALLHHDVSWGGFALFSGLFLVVWWGWVGNTVFISRFDLEDHLQRLLLLGQMLAVSALAVQLDQVTADGGVGFALSFIAIRAFLVVFYGRAWRQFPHARPFISSLMTGFALGGVGCWALSLFVPAPGRYVLWAVGLTIDLLTPLVRPRSAKRSPAHTAHMPERFGVLTMIVLGEGLLAVIGGVDAAHWQAQGVEAGIFGFVIAAAICWNYFHFVEHAPLQCSLGSGQAYTYWHLPLTYGLVLAAVGGALVIREASAPYLSAPALWLLAGGLGSFILAFAAVQIATYPKSERKQQLLTTGVALGALVVLSLIGARLAPVTAIGLLALGMVALTAWAVKRRARIPSRAYQSRGEAPTGEPKTYEGDEIVVQFDAARCIHSGECLRRLPEVFDTKSRPWVRADAASADIVAETIRHCPTRALTYEWRAERPEPGLPPASQTNTTDSSSLTGPIRIQGGTVRLLDGTTLDTDKPVLLCACGRSQRWPLCDGSHAPNTPNA